METYSVFEIAHRLIGPITACGEHGEDMRRLGNLKRLIELTDGLLAVIRGQVHNASSHEASVRAIGLEAKQFIDTLSESEEEA